MTGYKEIRKGVYEEVSAPKGKKVDAERLVEILRHSVDERNEQGSARPKEKQVSSF